MRNLREGFWNYPQFLYGIEVQGDRALFFFNLITWPFHQPIIKVFQPYRLIILPTTIKVCGHVFLHHYHHQSRVIRTILYLEWILLGMGMDAAFQECPVYLLVVPNSQFLCTIWSWAVISYFWFTVQWAIIFIAYTFYHSVMVTGINNAFCRWLSWNLTNSILS